jgi:cysteine desulfurase family protein (TIGR01976 family)
VRVPSSVKISGDAAATTIEAVRARFTALQRPLAFFDGPGGTQVPDSVIEAISDYLRSSNANSGGPFETSNATDALTDLARSVAAGFLNATSDEVLFGANMTTLNFALSRAASRDWQAGDEIVCTKLDHDGNVSPWLELARDKGLTVHFAEVDDTCRLDLDHLRSLLTERTRVVAFPWASNAVGTVTPVAEIAAIAHDAGALAWVDAVHYGPHGPIDIQATGADVLLCSPYKYYGPHLGLAFGKRDLLESWRPYKVRPAPDLPVGHRYETGTLAFELLAGFVAAVAYLDEIGWDFIRAHEGTLGQQFLDALPDGWRLYGAPTMEGRVPTFAIGHGSVSPRDAAERLGERGFAVWDGNYYAVEIMKRLGLDDGAVRIGIVHYNTADEVARLVDALGEIAG